MNFLKDLLFSPSKRIQRLISEVENDHKAVYNFVEQYDPLMVPYCSVQQSRCTSCGLLFWKKDKDHRYISANDFHCNVFYNMSFQDAKRIVGKTDLELIEDFRKRYGEHTFGELCASSDVYVQKKKTTTRFFELGYCLGKPLLLDVVKKPVFSNNVFAGTIGHATNVSDRESDACILIEALLKQGFAKRLDDGTKSDTACYLIKEQAKKFNRNFPK